MEAIDENYSEMMDLVQGEDKKKPNNEPESKKRKINKIKNGKLIM